RFHFLPCHARWPSRFVPAIVYLADCRLWHERSQALSSRRAVSKKVPFDIAYVMLFLLICANFSMIWNRHPRGELNEQALVLLRDRVGQERLVRGLAAADGVEQSAELNKSELSSDRRQRLAT